MTYEGDPHFIQFIGRLEGVLLGHGQNSAVLQNYQLGKLIELEKKFRGALVRHRWGSDVYQGFIADMKNILLARPYFRERDDVFKTRISPVLKQKDHRALYRFNVNYQFIKYVLSKRDWSRNAPGRRLLVLADEVKDLRNDLVECNLPLAISQAKMFWGRNRESHHTYMDYNQIAAVGLLEAADKFCPPPEVVDKRKKPRSAFAGMAIGRMLGNCIEDNSQTFVHFYPPDKRRIYRARKIIGSMKDGGPIDYAEVCRRLNLKEAEEGDPQTSLGDLVNLLSATQVMSAEALAGASEESEGKEPNPIEKFAAEDDTRPDVKYEAAQTNHAVAAAIKALPMMDQKLLRLRGVDF